LISIKKTLYTFTKSEVSTYHYDNAKQVAAEQDLQYLPKEEIEKRIREKRKHQRIRLYCGCQITG